MKDNDLIMLIRLELISALNKFGYSNVNILHSSQLNQEEKPTGPTLYIHKVTDVRYGSPQHNEQYNCDLQRMERTTTEINISTYQIHSFFIYDTSDPSALTMSELVRTAARAMQLPEFQKALIKNGVNIMRIDKVNYVDSDNKSIDYEEKPFFNFQINHKDIYTTEIPCTGKIIRKMERI